MQEFAVVITNMEVVYVNAETEEQAIDFVRAKLPPTFYCNLANS